MLKQAVLGGLIASVVVAACSGGSPSEQVVRRNLPTDRAAAVDAAGGGAPRGERGRADKKGLTSQEVEKELNRLEAELR
jgi:hypothetical protein